MSHSWIRRIHIANMSAFPKFTYKFNFLLKQTKCECCIHFRLGFKAMNGNLNKLDHYFAFL